MSELVEHLKTLPNDWDSWLVHADQLIQRGDPRGEILVLEHRGVDRARELADDWVTTWGENLGSANLESYLWIRSLAPLAGAPTPLEVRPVFAQPVGQLLALLDRDHVWPEGEVSPVFEAHRVRVFDAVRRWIELAFDGVSPPDEEHVTLYQAEAADGYGSCDRSADHFGRWQELPEAHLLANQWAIPHLDEQGMHYYVPAIMCFALRQMVGVNPTGGWHSHQHWITESLEYSLEPNDTQSDWQRDKLQLFDRGQRAATYAFVLVVGQAKGTNAWARVFEAEREGERADWFDIFAGRP